MAPRYPSGATLAAKAKQEHAEFARSYEFDYLLARCRIAQIEFDEAREFLRQVLDAPAARNRSRTARTWMLGEVYFLQRQYPQAQEAYAQVARMNAFPIGRHAPCCSRPSATNYFTDPQALADYQRALQLSQQPDIQQQATKRIGAIESLSPTLR